MYPVTLFHLFLVLGGAALLLLRGRHSAIAAEGLLAFVVGGASLQISAQTSGSLTLEAVARVDAPPFFLVVSLGLLLLGPITGLLAGVLAWRATGAEGIRGRLLLAGVIWLTAFAALMRTALQAGAPAALLAALALMVAAVALYRLGRVSQVGTIVRYLDLHWFTRWHLARRVRAPGRADTVWLAVLAAGILAITVTDHVGVIIVGAFGLTVAAHVLAVRLWDGPRFPVLPVLAAGLIPLGWYLFQLSAAGQWSMADPALAPLTANVEMRLLPLVLLAAGGLAALWPVHGLVPNGVLAPIGGILLYRLGAGFLPAGLFYWQPLLSPLALASVWWGALTGRRTLVLSGWAFQALVSDFPMASEGAFWLLGVAAALSLVPVIPERFQGLAVRGLAGASILGVAWTLPGMMRSQLIYSLLAVAAVGVALWRKRETTTSRAD